MKNLASLSLLLACVLSAFPTAADTRLPSIFSDHMVLQRDQPCKIWGWDNPEQNVTVTFADQTRTATVNASGRWEVIFHPLAASAAPRKLRVVGSTEVTVRDVLVGEVWICAGQSNMVWQIYRSLDGDLDQLAAGNSQLRFLRVPSVGTQEPQTDFQGHWERASPETVANFSAIGFHFGHRLQQILGVPVGLINNAWGGSSIESWIPREALESANALRDFTEAHRSFEIYQQTDAAEARHHESMQRWHAEVAAAKAKRLRSPPRPQSPERWMQGNKRFGNAFNGSTYPIVGYTIRGILWYQGESNRIYAASYYELFPLLITQWREHWGQGNFPFYWVQLADFHEEASVGSDSGLAEIREAQTRAQSLPNTGQAVIIDLGEAANIHPQNKLPVAHRLLRLALHHDYGFTELGHRSPEYEQHKVLNDRFIIELNTFGEALKTFDSAKVSGFSICASDYQWMPAEAKLIGNDRVEVWHENISTPVAVRYAWADNPICNLTNSIGLPVTPFRTDDKPASTPIFPLAEIQQIPKQPVRSQR
jgi:sialate O-acetylesterase